MDEHFDSVEDAEERDELDEDAAAERARRFTDGDEGGFAFA
jgi:hypothetical protein